MNCLTSFAVSLGNAKVNAESYTRLDRASNVNILCQAAQQRAFRYFNEEGVNLPEIDDFFYGSKKECERGESSLSFGKAKVDQKVRLQLETVLAPIFLGFKRKKRELGAEQLAERVASLLAGLFLIESLHLRVYGLLYRKNQERVLTMRACSGDVEGADRVLQDVLKDLSQNPSSQGVWAAKKLVRVVALAQVASANCGVKKPIGYLLNKEKELREITVKIPVRVDNKKCGIEAPLSLGDIKSVFAEVVGLLVKQRRMNDAQEYLSQLSEESELWFLAQKAVGLGYAEQGNLDKALEIARDLKKRRTQRIYLNYKQIEAVEVYLKVLEKQVQLKKFDRLTSTIKEIGDIKGVYKALTYLYSQVSEESLMAYILSIQCGIKSGKIEEEQALAEGVESFIEEAIQLKIAEKNFYSAELYIDCSEKRKKEGVFSLFESFIEEGRIEAATALKYQLIGSTLYTEATFLLMKKEFERGWEPKLLQKYEVIIDSFGPGDSRDRGYAILVDEALKKGLVQLAESFVNTIKYESIKIKNHKKVFEWILNKKKFDRSQSYISQYVKGDDFIEVEALKYAKERRFGRAIKEVSLIWGERKAEFIGTFLAMAIKHKGQKEGEKLVLSVLNNKNLDYSERVESLQEMVERGVEIERFRTAFNIINSIKESDLDNEDKKTLISFLMQKWCESKGVEPIKAVLSEIKCREMHLRAVQVIIQALINKNQFDAVWSYINSLEFGYEDDGESDDEIADQILWEVVPALMDAVQEKKVSMGSLLAWLAGLRDDSSWSPSREQVTRQLIPWLVEREEVEEVKKLITADSQGLIPEVLEEIIETEIRKKRFINAVILIAGTKGEATEDLIDDLFQAVLNPV